MSLEGKAGGEGNVRVMLRVRPLNQKEIERGGDICIRFLDEQTVKIKFSEEQEKSKSAENIPNFNFDRVFPLNTTQKEIFLHAAKPVIECIFQGFNGTIFAYGQTSSGKTHTMQGPSLDNEEQKGIIPRMVDYVFDNIYNSPDHIEYRIKVSIIEIYMEKIRDLLNIANGNLQVREDKQKGIYIQDVTESYVSEESDVYNLMEYGNNNRAVGETNMNKDSSRSHMIFIMTISSNNTKDNSSVTGKLCLVDLAGSEKIEKTGAEGKTLDEAKLINKSLSELGNVINALTDQKQQHIPYRNSKLTRVLQESLGGNARTTLIITASPSQYNELETLSTLRFGIRAKSIKNKPKINKEWTVSELLLLLKKANNEIAIKTKRIKQLETYIQDLGQPLPANDYQIKEEEQGECAGDGQQQGESQYDQQLTTENEQIQNEGSENNDNSNQEKNSEEEEDEDEEQTQKKAEKISLNQQELQKQLQESTKVTEELKEYQESVLNLQDELNSEKQNSEQKDSIISNLEIQVQQLEKTWEEMKIYQQESQEQLEKNTDLTLQLTNTQEEIKDKDEQIEKQEIDIQELKKLLSSLNEEKKGFIMDITKKAEIIANIEMNNKAEEEQHQNTEKIIKRIQQQNQILMDQLSQRDDTLKQFVKSFQDKESEQLQELSKKIEQQTQSTSISSQIIQNEESDITKIINDSQDKIQQQDQKIKLLESEIESHKQIQQNIIQEQEKDKKTKYISLEKLASIENDYKKQLEQANIDIQNQVNKYIEIQMQLCEERDQKKQLQESVGSSKKKTKNKYKEMEQNVVNLTAAYHQLIQKYSDQSSNEEINQTKIKRKNERILHLEENVKTVREQMLLYKKKYEDMKKQLDTQKQSRVKNGSVSFQKSQLSHLNLATGLSQYNPENNNNNNNSNINSELSTPKHYAQSFNDGYLGDQNSHIQFDRDRQKKLNPLMTNFGQKIQKPLRGQKKQEDRKK